MLNFNLMPLPGYPVILETNVAGSPSSIVVFFGPSTTDGALTASIGFGASSVSGGPTGTKQEFLVIIYIKKAEIQFDDISVITK